MSEQGGRKLDTPPSTRRTISFNLDSDVVGMYSERVARFLGTGRYLLIQTVIVIVWIALNLVAVTIRWDPYPFILLNLAFSTQAAYAAPLILLAQNRQENRDRVALEEDRMRSAQTKADTEFLARELLPSASPSATRSRATTCARNSTTCSTSWWSASAYAARTLRTTRQATPGPADALLRPLDISPLCHSSNFLPMSLPP